MGIPFKGLLKKAAGAAITKITGTHSTPKQRGTLYALLSLAVGFLLVKFGGLDADTANQLTDHALEYLPK